MAWWFLLYSTQDLITYMGAVCDWFKCQPTNCYNFQRWVGWVYLSSSYILAQVTSSLKSLVVYNISLVPCTLYSVLLFFLPTRRSSLEFSKHSLKPKCGCLSYQVGSCWCVSQCSPLLLFPYLCTQPEPLCPSPHVLFHRSPYWPSHHVSPCFSPWPCWLKRSSHLSPHFVPSDLSAHLSVYFIEAPCPSYSSPHLHRALQSLRTYDLTQNSDAPKTY